MKAQGKVNSLKQQSAPNRDAPKKNLFYALRSGVDQEESPYVVTGMLQVFSINICSY